MMKYKIISITIFVLLSILTAFIVRTKLYYKHHRIETLVKDNRYKYSESFQMKINGKLVTCKDTTCKEVIIPDVAREEQKYQNRDVQNDYLNILGRYTDIDVVVEGVIKDSTITIESDWFSILVTFQIESDTLVIREIQVEDTELACID